MDNLLIKKELIIFASKQTSQEGVFSEAFKCLQKKGYVFESYLDALIKREREHPTALVLENTNIAIPHVDPVHVKKNGIMMMTLKEPVIFNDMLDRRDVEVKYVFFLILNSGETHLGALSSLMSMMQSEDMIDAIKECKSKEDLYNVMVSYKNTLSQDQISI